jgi:hypothetical protein
LLLSRALAAFLSLGAFFAGLAFFPDLPFFGARLAPFFAALAFFLAFGWSPLAAVWAVVVASVTCDVIISCSFVGGNYRVVDIDHSAAPGKQAHSARQRRWNGDEVGLLRHLGNDT